MLGMKRWVLGAVLLAAGCANAPGEEQCRDLLDHLVDLEFKKAGAVASDSAKGDLAKQKAAVSDAKSSEFVDTCVKKTARARIDCALAARDLEGVAKCDEVK
jgi:hypothetical protein